MGAVEEGLFNLDERIDTPPKDQAGRNKEYKIP